MKRREIEVGGETETKKRRASVCDANKGQDIQVRRGGRVTSVIIVMFTL